MGEIIPAPGRFAVEVDESKIYATGVGADWWIHFRKANAPERFTSIKSGWPGDTVHVACDSEEDAKALARHMIAFAGMYKSCAKAVKTRG